nr:hypothetical protein [Corynebacterium sp. UBA5992]
MPKHDPMWKAAAVKTVAAIAAFSLSVSFLSACTNSERASTQTKRDDGTLKYGESSVPASAVPDNTGEILGGNDKLQQLSYYRMRDGIRMGSKSEHAARPALSLIKLYIATYVVEEGEFADKYEALDMVANSSDISAEELFDKYPESVDDIAKEYGLESTESGPGWGQSLTSTYDVVDFIVQLRKRDETHPVLVAMAHADPISADGYEQNYGTAELDDVIGTKWGWSDGRDLHSSVSFGEDFVVAASSYGSADDLSAYVKKQVTEDNIEKAERRYQRAQKGETFPETTERKSAEPQATSTVPSSSSSGAASTSSASRPSATSQR